MSGDETTKDQMIENAARLLRNKENAHSRVYGSSNSIALELAKAWTELAEVTDDER